MLNAMFFSVRGTLQKVTRNLNKDHQKPNVFTYENTHLQTSFSISTLINSVTLCSALCSFPCKLSAFSFNKRLLSFVSLSNASKHKKHIVWFYPLSWECKFGHHQEFVGPIFFKCLPFVRANRQNTHVDRLKVFKRTCTLLCNVVKRANH